MAPQELLVTNVSEEIVAPSSGWNEATEPEIYTDRTVWKWRDAPSLLTRISSGNHFFTGTTLVTFLLIPIGSPSVSPDMPHFSHTLALLARTTRIFEMRHSAWRLLTAGIYGKIVPRGQKKWMTLLPKAESILPENQNLSYRESMGSGCECGLHLVSCDSV